MNNNSNTKIRGPYGESRYELTPNHIFIMTDLYKDYEEDLDDGRVDTSHTRVSRMHSSQRTIEGDNLLHTLARVGEAHWQQAIYVVNLTRPERDLLYAKNADGLTPFELAFHKREYAMAYALMLLEYNSAHMNREHEEEETPASPNYVPNYGNETTVLDETVLDRTGDETVLDGAEEEYQVTPESSPLRAGPRRGLIPPSIGTVSPMANVEGGRQVTPGTPPQRITRRRSPPPVPRRGLIPPSIGTVSYAVKRPSKCLEFSKEKDGSSTPPPANKKPKTEKQ